MRRTTTILLLAVALGASGLAAGAGPARPLSLLEGRVAAVAADGTLVLEDGTRVTAGGRLEGPVEPGSVVRAVGRLGGDGLVPLRLEIEAPRSRSLPEAGPARIEGAVERRRRDRSLAWVAVVHGAMEMEVTGVVLSVDAVGFELRDEESGMSWRVGVTAATQWIGISGLDALAEGDRVRVRGSAEDHTITAESVELLGGDDGDGDGGGGGGDGGCCGGHEAHHESEGWVEALLPPDRFRLDDGRTYRVTAATVWDPAIGGYTGLQEGDFVEVRAGYRAGELVASEVRLEGERGGTHRESLTGAVASVSATGLVLEDGTAVAFGPRTEFEGDAERWSDLAPGWWVRVEAVRMMTSDRWLALEVLADDRTPPTVEGESFEPHRALVVLVEGASAQAVAGRHGATVAGSISGGVALLEWARELDDALLAELENDPDVVAVEPNYLFRDPESERKRYPIVDRSATTADFTGQPAVAVAGVTGVAVPASGSGIVVAVMDTGVDPLHPALRGRLGEPGLDVVDGDLEPWETRDGLDEDGDGDVDEAAGHGTFVASVVGLVAPGATIVPYRVLDDDGGGTAYGLALALADAIRRHVDVINLSLAYRTPSRAVDALLAEAERRGIVVVASAGNDGAPELPYPASDGHTLAVTALAADGSGLAAFANTGPSPILAAPGEDVFGALDGRQWGTSSGSSMAAPFVSGAAALLLELDPRLDPGVVRDVLVQTARAIADGGATDGALDVAAAVAVAAP